MSTNVVSRLQDQGAIAMATGSQTEKSIIKATRHNLKAPKEKHVRRLLMICSEKTHKINNLVSLLTRRLETPDWIVVLKTLVVFHRLLREAPNRLLIQTLKYKSDIFGRLRKFVDMSSQEAHHQSIFIRKYSQYLEEKVLVFKTLTTEFEKDPSITKSYTVDELLERLPRLQSQLNALINCRASKEHINNAIIITAWNYLLKDSFKLFSALNFGVIILLEHYFTMPKETASKIYEIYKLFTRETDGMTAVMNISQRFTRSEIPELQHAPLTLLESLEGYLKDLEEGRAPNEQDKQQPHDLGKANHKVEQSLFDTNELVFKNPDEMAENIPFDPFGINEEPKQRSSSTSTGQSPFPPSFDPFADEKSESNLPTIGFFDEQNNSPSLFPAFDEKPAPSSTQSSSTLSFDPFGDLPQSTQSQQTTFSFDSTTPTSGNYENKKAQIEMLMKTNYPNQPSSTQNTNISNQSSFESFDAFNANNQPTENQSPWGAISQNNPSFNPLTDVSSSSSNNPFFSTDNKESNSSNPFF